MMLKQVGLLVVVAVVCLQVAEAAYAYWPFTRSSACNQGPVCRSRECKPRECRRAPQPEFAYQFGARLQDNPLPLQSNQEEVEQRLTEVEKQMQEMLVEFKVLMEVLAK